MSRGRGRIRDKRPEEEEEKDGENELSLLEVKSFADTTRRIGRRD